MYKQFILYKKIDNFFSITMTNMRRVPRTPAAPTSVFNVLSRDIDSFCFALVKIHLDAESGRGISGRSLADTKSEEIHCLEEIWLAESSHR